MQTAKTNYELVEEQMKRGLWLTTWEIAANIAASYEDRDGKPRRMSEAGCSARIRELGAHDLKYDKKPRMGSNSFEYRLKDEYLPLLPMFWETLVSERDVEATR